MLSATTEIRVRYAETDKMGVVYHANYFVWFEAARIQLLDDLGLPYNDLEERGYLLPVLECGAKFLQPAHFDDRLTAYHFRHWAITDWLNAGIVSVNVATLAGTSIGMIERYYKKFVRGHVNDQLAEMEVL